ncbi:hypothetical protein [Marinilactibacillus psychrotolerans]|uniref:hypothetical protein n=1 Tax=Marinilactibacillus psychrotolerans TaxID=191770 RepID=UPI001C7D4E3D|nr:hypothetical protein [Marinilactibacillus psychrotolerans]
MDYVLSLSLRRASKLLNKAIESKKREDTYQWWLARYPTYTEETYESFDEFYEKVYPPKVEMDTRSKDEIMNEILGKEG